MSRGIDVEVYDDDNVQVNTDRIVFEMTHPYVSLERLRSYLYRVTFNTIPDEIIGNPVPAGGCSSFVRDGKLYRNLDWDYNENPSFHVVCKGFEGMAFDQTIVDGNIIDEKISQLPYKICDGRNDYGIRVSEHVLFNDWQWEGHGRIPLYKLPYIILSTVKTLNNFESQMANVLGDLYPHQALVDSEYLLQFIVTDGTTTYAILPPESSSGSYVVVNITENPKLTNFRWVSDEIVDRHDLQNRPTGVERWNEIDDEVSLFDLKFTRAYDAPSRLSDFIGLRGTTKDSPDSALFSIYETAREIYEHRTRNGQTWQTVHSIVYSEDEIEHLYVQENYDKDWSGKCFGDMSKSVYDTQNRQTDIFGYTDSAVSEHNEDLTAHNDIREEISGLDNSKVDKNIMQNTPVDISTEITPSSTGVLIIHNKKNIVTGTTSSEQDSMPIANSSQVGMMTPEQVEKIEDLESRVGGLEGQNVRLSYSESANPTSAQIRQFVIDLGYTDVTKWDSIGVVIKDTNHIWRYYSNTQIWEDIGLDTVQQASQSVKGIVQGSSTNGKIFVEADGTMSLNGYDEIKGDIRDLDENKAGKDEIPTELSQLSQDPTHRVVTDTEKSTWNAKVSSVENVTPDLNGNVTLFQITDVVVEEG